MALNGWNGFAVLLAVFAALLINFWPFEKTTVKISEIPDTELQTEFDVSTERLSLRHIPFPNTSTADVTAVILNWSRLPNVVRIVSTLCDPILDDVLATIFIWNNNPSIVLTDEELGCRHKVKVFNSPHNAYFAARFEACAGASTPFCFIQDDDYLVLPEIVYTLRSQASETSPSGIFLQPPDELLASTTSRTTVESTVHTSFSWLGYGSMIRRSEAIEFLDLLRLLRLSEEEVKMADNYFSILRNVFTENWLDQNIPLGGGQAFTVGQEGTERNNRHIRKAGELVDSILLCATPPCITSSTNTKLPYIWSRNDLRSLTMKAPCVGAVCMVESSITGLPDILDTNATSARDMLDVQKRNIQSLTTEERDMYLEHPLSLAVDGKLDTAYCRPNARKGDYLSLTALHSPSTWRRFGLALLVDTGGEIALVKSSFHLSEDGELRNIGSVACSQVKGGLKECSTRLESRRRDGGPLSFRLVFDESITESWCIQEMWIRGV